MKNLATLLLACSTSFANAQYLDPAWGLNGVASAMPSTYSYFHDIAVATDGKVYACGPMRISLEQFAQVSRFNTDGTLDETWGDGGLALGPEGVSLAEGIALLEDGRVVMAGSRSGVATVNPASLLCFLADGTLDPSFGSGGELTFGTEQRTMFRDVAIDPSGRILAVGFTGGPSHRAIVTVRCMPNGTLDPSFNGTGMMVHAAAPGIQSEAMACHVLSDGSVLVGGYEGVTLGSPGKLCVMKLTASGALDTGFGTLGFVRLEVNSQVTCFASLPNGDLLVGGWLEEAPWTNDDAGIVLRLSPNGSLVTGFGAAGTARLELAADSSTMIGDLLVLADGTILVGGELDPYADQENNDHTFVAAIDNNGHLVTSFGDEGVISGSEVSKGRGQLDMDAQGRLYQCGYVGGVTSMNGQASVMRFAMNMLGVAALEHGLRLGLYPVPADAQVSVRLPEGMAGTVQVVDAMGRSVAMDPQSGQLSGTLMLNTARLAAGRYTLRAANDERVLTAPLVVVH